MKNKTVLFAAIAAIATCGLANAGSTTPPKPVHDFEVGTGSTPPVHDFEVISDSPLPVHDFERSGTPQ